MENNRWKSLAWIGKANNVLGIIFLCRSISELFQIWTWAAHPPGLYLAVMLLDVPLAALWLQSGRALRQRQVGALLLTVIAGGMAFVDSVIGAILMGPKMVQAIMDPHSTGFTLRAGIFGGRLLLYGIQIIYSPFVVGVALLDYNRKGLPEVYHRFTRPFLVLALIVSVVILGVIQFVIKWAVTHP